MATLIAIVLGLCLLASPLVIVVLLLRGAARNRHTRERVDALELHVERLSDQLKELFEVEPFVEPIPAAAVSIESARVFSPVAVPTPIVVIPPPIVVSRPIVVAPPPIVVSRPIVVAPPPIAAAPPPIVVPPSIVAAPKVERVQTVESPSPANAESTVQWTERFAATDWEALVGGNWLNKAGVLVFIIGLSLFLGYSLTRFGPIGRVSIGWVVSIGLLAAGTILERRPGYGLFGRGLLAGGWAGAYFTSYAMYALPAARVIENPIAGTALLMSVAAGMVIHSLRYRSEALTGLTYFIAFATLNIAPVNSFTLSASVPLAASLLTIAYRQRWTTMSVVGVIFTYGSLMMRMAASTTSATVDELRIVQAILVTYWLLFELFDLIDLRRRTSPAPSAALFPLNATGFLGLSVLLWSDHPGASAYLYGISAVGYLASAILRAFVAPARAAAGTFSEPEWQVARGHEAAVTVASALAAATIGLTFHGIQLSTALALEGELLLLSGLRLKGPYPFEDWLQSF